MPRNTFVVLVCALLSATSGCVPWGDYFTVPWWKGVPTTVIAPSSLEAMAWQEQHRLRHQQHFADAPVEVFDIPTEALQEAPAPADEAPPEATLEAY